MQIIAIHTEAIRPGSRPLLDILDVVIPTMQERCILVVTSKIVAICEGSTVCFDKADKAELIGSEAFRYLPPQTSQYGITLTIKRNILVPTAGIDESNGDGHYVLWPRNPQASANEIRRYLKKRFGLSQVGVVITDSKTTPLRYGTTGIGLAHSGFLALRNYIGEPDIFGHEMRVTKANYLDALSAAAVLVMGEGSEQTPLALISDVPFIEFQDRNPSAEELDGLTINPEDDLYAPLLTSVTWTRGEAEY